MFAPIAFALAALFATVAADLKVTNPGGPNFWWVARSQNVVAWTCQQSQFTNFTIMIANSDAKILSGNLAIVPIQNNFDCSRLLTQEQVNQTPATGYTILLANPFNQTEIYATSDPFEIKPLGSAYPVTSSAGPSGTASGSGSSPSGGANNNGALSTLDASTGFVWAAGLAVAGLLL